MKKYILFSVFALAAGLSQATAPRAYYVHRADGSYTKYSFGVAEALNFTDNGKTLLVNGYEEKIDMDNVDYISFSPTEFFSGAITPADQKKKLVEIGDELYKKFDIYRNPDLLNMWHYFFDHVEKGLEESCPPTEFDVPEDYYDVHHAFRGLLGATKEMTDGNPLAVREFKARATDLYKIEDYNGVYVANYSKRVWERTSRPDYIEIRYASPTSQYYFVRLEYSTDFCSWDTSDFSLEFPRKMNVTFGQGDKVFATAVIDTNIVPDVSIEMNIVFTANGYVVTDDMFVTDSMLLDNAKVILDGETVVTANTQFPGKNLVNYNSMRDAIKESFHYHDEQGNCAGSDPTELFAHFTKGVARTDILGKLQVSGRVYNPSKFYGIVSQETEPYYKLKTGKNTYVYTRGRIMENRGDELVVSTEEESVFEDIAQAINDFTDGRYYYDGNTDLQGYITVDYQKESDSYKPYTDNRFGYCVVGQNLVDVNREEIWDYNSEGEYVIIGYTDWKYWVNYEDEETGEYLGNAQVAVPASSVIFPAKLTDIYYEIVPLICFPDGTSYAIVDFFDENHFKTVIDDYNSIINSYLSITGQE